MAGNKYLAIFYAFFLVTANAQDSFSDNVALFWNLYDSVVTGSRILHDVTEGVGAVSKAIKAIDVFLDTDAENQLADSIADAQTEDTADPVPQEETTTAAEECDAASGDQTCTAKPKKKRTKTAAKKTPAVSEPEMPKFNGCGALGFHIRDSNLPVSKMIECCGVHNNCYSGKCRANKRDCDSKLRYCLFSTCDDRTLDRSFKRPCYAAAKLLFSGTMALSYQQYKDAQDALNCPG